MYSTLEDKLVKIHSINGTNHYIFSVVKYIIHGYNFLVTFFIKGIINNNWYPK